MAVKEKKAQKARGHKESQHKHGGGGKVKLTELQKVLIANGGMGHRLRKNSMAPRPIKNRSARSAD